MLDIIFIPSRSAHLVLVHWGVMVEYSMAGNRPLLAGEPDLAGNRPRFQPNKLE
jgi:hypothetical protein